MAQACRDRASGFGRHAALSISEIERLVERVIDSEATILRISRRNTEGDYTIVSDDEVQALIKELERRLGVPVFKNRNPGVYPALVLNSPPGLWEPIAWLELSEDSGVVFMPKGRSVRAYSYGLSEPIEITKETGICTHWLDTACCDPDDDFCNFYRYCMQGGCGPGWY